MAPQNQLPAMGLDALVDQIEELQTERRQVDAQLAEAYRMAKGEGFDPKALKALIARRAADRTQAVEQDALVDLYEAQLQKAAAGDGRREAA